MNEIEIEVDPADFGCQAARVVSICASKGQQVKCGETLIEFECDKASFEVSMPSNGTVQRFLVTEGSRITDRTAVVAIESIDSHDDKKGKPEVAAKSLDLLKSRYHVCGNCTSLRSAVEILEAGCEVTEVDVSDSADLAKIYRDSRTVTTGEEIGSSFKTDCEWYENQILNRQKQFFKCCLHHSEQEPETIGFSNVETVNRAPGIAYHFIGLYVVSPKLQWTCANILITRSLDAIKTQGVESLFAITSGVNNSAQRLLDHFEFEEFGSFSDPNYSKSTSLFYIKEI